jgi:hypothetical protein
MTIDWQVVLVASAAVLLRLVAMAADRGHLSQAVDDLSCHDHSSDSRQP